MSVQFLEYVWLDGCDPWGLRSKIKVANIDDKGSLAAGSVAHVPVWGFDGSSTEQATGSDSDCILKPVAVFMNPLLENSYIVWCGVYNPDGAPHATNFRIQAEHAAIKAAALEPWVGIEQEYTIIKQDRPYGFPATGYPAPQGKYYCSVGGDRNFGRIIADTHMVACTKAGISITGTNAEVMPGQWEFQVGGPGVGPLAAADQLWAARWLLLKIAERHGMTVTFDPKPMLGDWNGAGAHTNFSTKQMRENGGLREIEQMCEKLSQRVDQHLTAYGTGIELRLTGQHETCSYQEFRWGVADRTASVRIPRQVAIDGYGYLEDRRPNANCDPYRVVCELLKTACSQCNFFV